MNVQRIFALAKADADVAALLSSGAKLRFYGFGEAPEGAKDPYAIWQLVGGFPENKLADVPDVDTFVVQIDAYAKLEGDAREVAVALRDALEPHGYLTGYNFEGREPNTRLYRVSFTMEFMESRQLNGS